jgi:hypothetical protein
MGEVKCAVAREEQARREQVRFCSTAVIGAQYPAIRLVRESVTHGSVSIEPRLHCVNCPNTATPVGVPTYTFPLTTNGVINLFPLPKASRPFAACVLL